MNMPQSPKLPPPPRQELPGSGGTRQRTIVMRRLLRAVIGALALFASISCTETIIEENKEETLATLAEVEELFEKGEILSGATNKEGGRLLVSFLSGRSLLLDSEEIGLVKCDGTWPAVTLDEDDVWTVDGKSREIPYSKEGTRYIATYRDSKGLWFRLDDGRILFFTKTKSEVGCFRAEKSLNERLGADTDASVDGRSVSFKASDLYPVSKSLIATIAVRGRSLTYKGEPYINGRTSLDLQVSELRYTDFTGERRTLTLTTDIKPQLPIMEIETEGRQAVIEKDTYLNATVRIIDEHSYYGECGDLQVSGKVKGRGNTTWTMPKKPYRLKFDSKSPVLGMPSSKSWNLLANYSDKTLVRNSAALRLSQTVGGLVWTPKHRYVELYFNGSYEGVYMLTEKVDPGKDKVPLDISGVDEGTDLTGGYFLEVDDKQTEPNRIITKHGVPIGLKEPEDATPEQLAYIWDFIQRVEDSIYDASPSDPVKGYTAFMDVDSFIANYLVQEVTKNIDGNFRLSVFLAKYKGDDHLQLCNVWDFDLAIGNCDYFPSMYGCTNTPDGLFVRGQSHWYSRLFNDPAFVARVKQRWAALYPKVSKVIDDVREEAGMMGDAIDRNFKRWPILGIYDWPNYYVNPLYSNNLEFMLDYLRQRADWLDAEISSW